RVEGDRQVRLAVGGVEERDVEPRARGRVDAALLVGGVGLEGEVALDGVDGAPAHEDGVGEHLVGKAELPERDDAARGEREVDRAAARRAVDARVGASLEELDRVAEPRKADRAERAREPGAEDGDNRTLPAHARDASEVSSSVRTSRRQSAKVL